MKTLLMLFLMRVNIPLREWLTQKSEPQSDPYSIDDYIVALQRDGRLLLRYLARRSDVALPDVATGGPTGEDACTDSLFASPATIRGDAAQMADLIHSVDLLSRRAAPANVRSIRLTSAYLGMSVEGGEPPPDIATESRQIRQHIKLLSFLAVVVFFLAVGFLADVDYGRRLLQQVERLRQQEQANQVALTTLKPEAFEARPLPTAPAASVKPSGNRPVPAQPQQQAKSQYLGPFCRADEPPRGSSVTKAQMPFRQPVSSEAINLCRQSDDIRHRIDLLYLGLADWNCWNYHVFPVNWLWATLDRKSVACGAPTSGQIQTMSQDVLIGWQSHETRVSASIAVMAGFALPMMLSFLGGCAYVLRRHDLKLASWTLEPHDGKHPWVRVLLAALLGGLVGVIWSSDEAVTVGGLTLSLAAVAFFVGFSVEAVFRLIQTLIDGVLSTIRAPDPTAAQSSQITTAQVRRIATDVASKQADSGKSNGGGNGRDNNNGGSDSGPGGVPADAPPAMRETLASLGDQLDQQRQVLSALAQLGTGNPAAAGSTDVLGAIEATLQTVQPLLRSGTIAPDILRNAVTQADKTLTLATNAGLPGLLADGVATLKGVADFAGPVLAGIPAGPIGIIGGIVLGGLQLIDNQQKFQAMKAALLRQPFDPTFRPHAPDDVTALAALEASPLMAARVPAKNAPFAIDLMQRLLEQDTSGTLLPAEQVAVTLMQPGDNLGLAERFESARELALAIEEFRGGLVFVEAAKRLDGSSVEIPDATGVRQTLTLPDLVKAALRLHADPRATTAIENAVALTEALTKLPLSRQATIDLVRQTLGQVTSIVATSRQVNPS